MEPPTQMTSLCRACLVLLPCDASDSAQYSHNLILERELAVRYVECTLLTLDMTDEFPKCICDSCYEMLLQVDAFQRMCAESMLNFRTYLDERLQLLKKETEMCASDAEVTGDDDHKYDNDNDVIEKAASTVDIEAASDEKEPTYAYNDAVVMLDKTVAAGQESVDDNFENAEAAATIKLEEVYVVTSTARDAEFAWQKEEEISAPPPTPPTSAIPRPVALTATFGDELYQTDVQLRDTDTPPVFHCEICPTRWFYTQKSLTAHKRTHFGLKPYFCQICCKQFGRIASLHMHNKEMHLQEKCTYYCTYEGCDRKYYADRSLRHHINRVHLKLKTREIHVCEKCGKKFDRQTLLSRHRYTHMDVSQYPYACDYCQKRFWCKTFLRDHVNRHVAVKVHVCPVCNARKITKGELQQHMKRHEDR